MKAECGLTAASEMQNAVHETVSRLQADLIDTPARTLAGLIFKARYAATHDSDDYDTDVMVSIVDDLLAMGRRASAMSDAIQAETVEVGRLARQGMACQTDQVRAPASGLPRRPGGLRRPRRAR